MSVYGSDRLGTRLRGLARVADGPSLRVAGDYVLATLYDVPFMEEGTYRFTIELDGTPPAVVEIPVWTYAERTEGVH